MADIKLTEENATTIVGVVGTVKQNDLADSQVLGTVYFPYKDFSSIGLSVIIRTPLDPAAMAETLRKTVLALDPALPVDDIKPMQALVDESLVTRRSPAVLAGAFAGVALLLAAIGTYGVLAYAVGQRRREIGVRMALGAQPQQVLAQFLSMGAKLLAVGVVLGLFFSWFVGRAMQSLLYGVDPVDAGVLAVTAVTLIAVVLLATFLPARRATKVDPMEALRSE